jgi:hypothetical protein
MLLIYYQQYRLYTVMTDSAEQNSSREADEKMNLLGNLKVCYHVTMPVVQGPIFKESTLGTK